MEIELRKLHIDIKSGRQTLDYRLKSYYVRH